ncbi:hypothetical protein [Flavobacterium reichenbachii]|uniref:DUF4595 domain-containing protein n=1 Tax=Flavobacterium reichenbachii TaxID=362418 RepID=A0A085ZQ34_9FLAO|nr:hypothetical protein [Flavobacterium reichenbachii]KFF06548.1 hypothetical protein IW19_13975 [Flavobacterium reichenbachii]OXB10977.1 hypothetical protein B0A68_21325 [Flavobacterium reichenbachii]
MKKKLLLIASFLLMLSSCSSDDNSSNPEEQLIFPKTISYIYPNSPQDNYKNIMTYDGNKIISMDRGNSIIKFVYEGNFIVKQLSFNVDSQGKETKRGERTYSYTNSKLSNITRRVNFSEAYPNGEDFLKFDFTHNADGTISYVAFMLSSTDIDYTGTLIYKDKNLIKRDIDVVSIPDYGHEISIYEYDTKNNPLKNIVGFDLILQEIVGYGSNNIVKMTRTIKDNPPVDVIKSNYLYNENNYPTKNNDIADVNYIYTRDIEYTY